jgi:nucleoside-diphosphate-sugar epimerase
MKTFVTGGSGFVGRYLIAALREAGHEVRALARSQSSMDTVRAAGAEPVKGDLDDAAALRAGMAGCDWVFHAAAHVKNWGTREEYRRANIEGTRNVLEAARAAGVKRFIHVGTEAVLVGGGPIVHADETRPRAAKPLGLYPWSKAESEALVVATNGGGLETVVVRPRFVWGKGDTTLIPILTQSVKSGAFRWIGGGRYLTSTTHVRNVCEGLLRAAERGRPGEIYFVTDGAPVEFKAFITELLGTQGVSIPDKAAPRGVVKALAAFAEALWTVLPLRGEPPVTRQAVALAGEEVTVNDAKARRELGYVGKVSREEGLAELRAEASARVAR